MERRRKKRRVSRRGNECSGRGRGREVGVIAPRVFGAATFTRARARERRYPSAPLLPLFLPLARSGERRGLCHVARVHAMTYRPTASRSSPATPRIGRPHASRLDIVRRDFLRRSLHFFLFFFLRHRISTRSAPKMTRSRRGIPPRDPDGMCQRRNRFSVDPFT